AQARRGTNFCTSTCHDRCYRFVIDLWHGRKLARDVLSEPACGRTPCAAPPHVGHRYQPGRQWRDRTGNAGGRSVAMRCYSAGRYPQYAPKLIAKHDEPDVDLMVALISTEPKFSPPNLYGPDHNGIVYVF